MTGYMLVNYLMRNSKYKIWKLTLLQKSLDTNP